jgi:hypothetical protein
VCERCDLSCHGSAYNRAPCRTSVLAAETPDSSARRIPGCRSRMMRAPGPGQPCPDCQPAEGKPQLPADWRSIASVDSAPVWTLRKADRTLTCRIRNDSRHGAGYDVQVF